MLMSRCRMLAFIFWIFLPSTLYAQTTVTGRVIFQGNPPSPEKVQVKSDVTTCGTEKEIRKIVLGHDQGISNAVVRIIGAQGTLTEKIGSLDQVNCEFVPHIQILPVGSTLKITSSDAVLHNSHGFYENGSTVFNIAVPIVGIEMPVKLKQAGIIRLRCDAGHTWMGAYVFVTDQPYYALTDADGNFSVEGVPPGNYEIEVWQEWLGKNRRPLKVKEGKMEPLVIRLETT